MSTNELFSLDAEEGSDDDDESFDDETGEARKRDKTENVNGHVDDSSEEEEDDDDEEAAAVVREGFIVDEEEDEDAEEEKRRRREKRKRRREERDEEGLDAEDLDLIGELEQPAPPESKFKRLKRGYRDEPRGVNDIFADDIDEDDVDPRRAADNEFDDFIIDDAPQDEEDIPLDDREVTRRPKRGLAGITSLQESGLDEADAEDMRAAFGDGSEYDWALDLQDDDEADEDAADKVLELKDVFEPSQLEEKMLTAGDDVIRSTDVPERYQIARKPFAEIHLSPEEAAKLNREEGLWIANMIWPKKRLDPELLAPFRASIQNVLQFMNEEDYEVPFIFQHRKDYLIHAQHTPLDGSAEDPNGSQYQVRAEKLLNQNDLWEILELDLKFRAFAEKKATLQKTYSKLQNLSIQDEMVEESLAEAVTMDELQDIQDYVNFQYTAELKDLNTINGETNGVQKRVRATSNLFEKIRASRAYGVVRGFGITADAFAQSALEPNRRGYTDDPSDRPEDMADQFCDEEFPTGAQVLRAAKSMFSEELFMSPRLRKLMRQTFFTQSHFDCNRTEKGLRKIDEEHPYYEFKYLRNQTLQSVARRPDLYLRMLKAEQEGLIDVQVQLDNATSFRRGLTKTLESDNFSEIADAWNITRREVLDAALSKLEKMMARSVKEHIKTECESQLARTCRDEYAKKLDQAPYKPKGLDPGTVPRVLAMTNGHGAANRDAIIWAWLDEHSRVLENGKFTDLRPGVVEKGVPDGADVAKLKELVERRRPDLIAISGFTVHTRALYKDVQTIVDQYDLKGPEYEDEDGNEKRDKVDVIMANDEVARLYHTSERSNIDLPGLAPLTKYCVALARYCQTPLREYAALGRDITSITFDPHQGLIPQEKLLKHLETAMVDMVNLVGVEINEAVADSGVANLLPYVCGLGPRKAARMLQVINRNGGKVTSRDELVGDPENDKYQAVGPKVWTNCASFLYIIFEEFDTNFDYLDNTRVHPEDYELARKMAADALELDEEDVKAEVDEFGPSAMVRKLVKEDKKDTVNTLILEMYADQLEKDFKSKKRATLETIRAELLNPYEELRRAFNPLSPEDIFTMLTGETGESLVEGMTVPVAVKKAFSDHIEVRLDSGIEGTISETDYPSGVGMGGVDARQAYQAHQTVQAKLIGLDRRRFTAVLSLRDDVMRRPFKREVEHMPGEWDDLQEDVDKREATKRKEEGTGRAQRVIKHPLFRPFNAAQAEEYLGPLNRGDCVIRPSSKGLDHLAVTWKVYDNVFQHIDVLELDKENEFSVGRVLKIGGRYTYSDLDELIVNHVKAMAKKVDEIMGDERFQNGTKAQTEQWLGAYMEANPKRSMYAFCLNRDYPGYFLLCFKASQKAKQSSWPVKVIPNAFQLQRNDYPTMMALKNGFKTLFQQQQQQQAAGRRGY